MINILDAEGKMLLDGNEEFLAHLEAATTSTRVLALHGLDRFEARKRIVDDDGGAGPASRRSSRTPTRCRTATARAW